MSARRAHIGAVSTFLFLIGCGSSDGTSVGSVATTLVTVDPASFRGDVVCGSQPGALRTYVATLTDVSVSPPFRLPSSAPTPCELTVSFAYVVPGHAYVASIEGYDTEAVTPRGGTSSGSPVMVDSETGERVAPVWSTQCGEADDSATVARSLRNVVVRGCSPLQRLQPTDEAWVAIDTAALLGDLSCGAGQGEVERLVVSSTDASFETREVACGETLVVPSPSGRVRRFDVAAFEAGATEPRWTARCDASSQAGATLPANCTPLSSKGTIRLRIDALLEHHGLRCAPGDVESFDVLVDRRMSLAGIGCQDAVTIGPLEPGDYELLVVALGRTEEGLVSKLMTQCPTTTVIGGQIVETSCLP